MPFVEADRRILDRCLRREPGAWEEFVDRFIGVFIHVIRHTAHSRSADLRPADVEDLCSEIFLTLLKNDFAVLRHFKGKSSLATYLAVVARRVVVNSLMAKKKVDGLQQSVAASAESAPDSQQIVQATVDSDEVRMLMGQLPPNESAIVKLFYLDGLSYQAISQQLGIKENTIGPTLTRARERLRQGKVATTK